MADIPRVFQLTAEQSGGRLDKTLGQIWPQVSRSRIQSWIDQGWVLVNGNLAEKRYLVNEFDTVEFSEQAMHDDLRAPTERLPEPEDIDIDVVYEDDDLLLINKHEQLVTHPAPGNWTGTLVNGLVYRYPELLKLPRCGVVHRLDRGTSGIMVVARSETGYRSLSEQIANRSMTRQYLAICRGKLVAGETIDEPIARHPVDRRKFLVLEDGRESITHVSKLEEFRAHTLVRLQLDTGRTHQIRVHMTHIKHPLLGDTLYGGFQAALEQASHELNTKLALFKRQALHSARLMLEHPQNNKILDRKVPMPLDMVELYKLLKEDTNRYDV